MTSKQLLIIASLLLISTSSLIALVSGEMGGKGKHAFKPLGSDRDEHGCIRTAGYIWCEVLRTCVRPWEVANYINQTYNPTPAWDSLAALASCKFGDYDISGFTPA